MKNVKRLDDLIEGIEHLISKNRCSLSESDISLLNETLLTLRNAKSEAESSKEEPPLEVISIAVKLLLRLLMISESIKEIL